MLGRCSSDAQIRKAGAPQGTPFGAEGPTLRSTRCGLGGRAVDRASLSSSEITTREQRKERADRGQREREGQK